MKNYNLTTKEQEFVTTHLRNNDVDAETPAELLRDNFSCQTMSDYHETMPYLSDKQIGGFLSSLEDKGVLYRDDQTQSGGFVLWWVRNDYLETLDQNAKF